MSDRATRLHEAEATMRMLQHEVRTPLGHIIGYSEMLEEEMLERNIEDLGEDLAKIRKAATRLLDLVDGKLLTDPTEEIAQARPLDSTAEEGTARTAEAPDATGAHFAERSSSSMQMWMRANDSCANSEVGA